MKLEKRIDETQRLKDVVVSGCSEVSLERFFAWLFGSADCTDSLALAAKAVRAIESEKRKLEQSRADINAGLCAP